jgi:GldM C-terminal domain
MKRLIILIIAIFLTSCLSKSYFSIRTNSSDVLYKGVQNAFFINGKGVENAIVSIENGTITLKEFKKDTANYFIRVGDSLTTKVTIKFNKNKHYEYVFRNKNIPTPYLVLATDDRVGFSNEIKLTNFKTFKGLLLGLNGFDYDCSFQILKYTMTRIQSDGKKTSYEWNDKDYNYVTNVFTRLANQAESGDVFIFSDCQIKVNETNEIRNTRDYVIRIR